VTKTDHPRARLLIARLCTSMSRIRLAPGKGKSPRIYVAVTDSQREELAALSAKTGRSMADLNREALCAWLATQHLEEVSQAS
jgi:hypothetical protein